MTPESIRSKRPGRALTGPSVQSAGGLRGQASLVLLEPSRPGAYRSSNTVAGRITGSKSVGIGAQKVASS